MVTDDEVNNVELFCILTFCLSDKENLVQSSHQHHTHFHHHQQHSSLSHPSTHVGGHESLSQNSSSNVEELLDEADTLAASCPCSPYSEGNCSEMPLHDCVNNYFDIDSNYSSDNESSPESVFSTSSGRSHATYRPRGNSSEPWLVAPAPCFTGSGVGELTPIASSPLENLLIEHPSMSVYLSFPFTPSHPYLSTRPTGENNAVPLQEEEAIESEERPVQTPAELVTRQHRHNIQAVLNPNLLISQQVKNLRSARRCQYIKAHENITSGKCQRQNKAMDCQGQPKGNSRKNKRARPSGFKASRVAQRM